MKLAASNREIQPGVEGIFFEHDGYLSDEANRKFGKYGEDYF